DDDAPGTAIPDPARAAKPVGTPGCKNAGTNVHARSRTSRSSPAEHSAELENLRLPTLSAGPRAATLRQLRLRRVPAAATDSAAVVPGDGPGPSRSLDSAGWPADAASVGPLADMLHCN